MPPAAPLVSSKDTDVEPGPAIRANPDSVVKALQDGGLVVTKDGNTIKVVRALCDEFNRVLKNIDLFKATPTPPLAARQPAKAQGGVWRCGRQGCNPGHRSTKPFTCYTCGEEATRVGS